MRMVFSHHVAGDLGALARGAVRRETQLVHSEKDTAMDGLQSVADIGQRATHDHAHRVVEIRAPHLVFDIYVGNVLLSLTAEGQL